MLPCAAVSHRIQGRDRSAGRPHLFHATSTPGTSPARLPRARAPEGGGPPLLFFSLCRSPELRTQGGVPLQQLYSQRADKGGGVWEVRVAVHAHLYRDAGKEGAGKCRMWEREREGKTLHAQRPMTCGRTVKHSHRSNPSSRAAALWRAQCAEGRSSRRMPACAGRRWMPCALHPAVQRLQQGARACSPPNARLQDPR